MLSPFHQRSPSSPFPPRLRRNGAAATDAAVAQVTDTVAAAFTQTSTVVAVTVAPRRWPRSSSPLPARRRSRPTVSPRSSKGLRTDGGRPYHQASLYLGDRTAWAW